ncbi:hypothetical protein [Mobilicoccus caccae]|uniref:Uncharacterized protein n=1 Tax=Mobilicoccus caccae TaxID=1859295 RepID=A0ABQ6IJF7_9MICO|nr:hypothetical protein GCM10025883_00950 [Mobilicoccus caccae]
MSATPATPPATTGPAPTAHPTASSSTATPPTSTRRTLVGTGIGNAIEWFDWSIYSSFAPFFAASFFVSTDPCRRSCRPSRCSPWASSHGPSAG